MSEQEEQSFKPHSSHWGLFQARDVDGKLEVLPHAADPDPSPLLRNFEDALRHKARIARPLVRKGWLERGPGPDDRRGRDSFVEMEWEEVLERVARELRRVRDDFGPEAVYGGSYGWSSAGRFHHSQSQIHRFLNMAVGGYVRSVNSYSAGASAVILPHVLAPYETISRQNVTWDQVREHTECIMAFGGMPLKTATVASGGVTQHVERDAMAAAHRRGCKFFLVSPLRDDLPAAVEADWLRIVPGTDTALMLALAHCIVSEGWHDRSFLQHYCTGWPQFSAYLFGQSDGQAKDAEWAEAICGIAAGQIRALARQIVRKRTLIVVAHALQRAEHGEQPVWMGVVLAAILGQIGLPGGGYGYALGSIAIYGRRSNVVASPSLPQGVNPVEVFIPVARVADMLLHPGQAFDYDGKTLTYPDTRLVYWAGGNPFHHHQDLSRLRRAFGRVDTLIVHESVMTATARHADIVLPCTMTLEREDIGSSANDPTLVSMHRIAQPFGEARDDYDIFADIAYRLGRREGDAFTQMRTSAQWVRHLYEETREALAGKGHEWPDFDAFWQNGEVAFPQAPDDGGPLRAFRTDPVAHPLRTPSGRIELYSETIARFGYADCPGHPAWLPPEERPNELHPLILVANQPATRLHSQLDFGRLSVARKVAGREVIRIHRQDAQARGIRTGDVVRVFNDRGACLASAQISEDILGGVVQLPTGAWYDPDDPQSDRPLCVHGNPNVVTRDVGTSRLAQGCTGQLTVVQVELYAGSPRPVRAYEPASVEQGAPRQAEGGR
ncbi:MAG: molybdopterin guanine dinucleotide-containing S/N-oxide reductase [Rhizobiaceae bacterium]